MYIYDENIIINQINKLKRSISYNNVLFCYAMKANSNLTLLETILHQGLGIDCVSQGELILALKAGFSPSTIRFTPTFSSTEEISYAIAVGVQISIDNLQILEWLAEKHPEQPIGLRINPSVMAGAYEKTSVGHAKAKFGIGLEHLPYLEQLIEKNGLKVNGLHIHSGSDILEISQFMEAVEVLLKVAPNFKNLEYIDLGSGFKVPYFDGDKAQMKLQKALLTLPEKQRLVFNMKYFDELKYQEISDILGTSVGGLKASFHLAVKKIEHYLLNS